MQIPPIDQSFAFSLGQSASKLTFHSSPAGGSLVRKSSEAGNTRFKAQYLKHKEALGLEGFLLKTPRLGEFGAEGQIEFYEMSYVASEPLGLFLEKSHADSLHAVADTIVGALESLFLSSVQDTYHEVRDALVLKIDSLFNHPVIANRAQPFFELAMYLRKTLVTIDVRKGWNHGDFSMDNLLCTSNLGEIFAIDFLDSPAETPLLDWGRIWLDARFGWWALGLSPKAAWVMNSRRLAQRLEIAGESLGVNRTMLDAFAAFAILRVVPYTQSATRLALLKFAARQILRESSR